MNFNYDLITWIDYFIGAFICCFGGFLIGKILLDKKFSDIKKIRLLLLIPCTIFTIFNTLIFDNILKIFGVLMLDVLIYRYILEEKSVKVFVYSVATILILSIGEILVAVLISLFDFIFKSSLGNSLSKAIYSNFLVVVFSIIAEKILKSKIINFLKRLNSVSVLVILSLFLLTIFLIFSVINILYIDKWQFSYKFILLVIIMIGAALLTFTSLKQYLKNKEVSTKHEMLEEYLKTSADLIEKYSSTLHKYKNNLIIIKSYLKSDTKEANKYVDSLLEQIKDKKYSWVSKTNYIQIDTIRYVTYYKLSKAEELNLKILVNISKDIKNIDSKFFDFNTLVQILDILGEYFDNAIYASNESKEKKLIFDLYELEQELVFVISNSFINPVDLNLINKNGYTTKGKNHGFGLYDVDKIIKNNKNLSCKYEIIDNYFITTFKVKLKKY